MSDAPDLNFILARLDRIQRELGMMRLRDEQREASHQALTITLSRQMVEISTSIDERLSAIEDRLNGISEILATIPTRDG